MTGVMVADEMGLGKTVQAIAILAVTDQRPAVIVCPTSLRLNWQREVRKWLPGWSIDLLAGTRPYPTDADVKIIGYDVLFAWVAELAPMTLILDEAHFAKNGQARRTKAAIMIADGCHERGGSVIALTGTPVLNNAQELVTQLRIIGRLDEFGGANKFKRDFADPSKLPALNRRLRATCFVRRRKTDVLTELPPKRWAEVVVEGDRSAMQEYKRAEMDIVHFLSERARTLAEESGLSEPEARRAAWEAALRAEAAQHLVAITALKRLAVRAKMPASRQWIGEFASTGKKLVVFGWHRETINMVTDEFANGCVVSGGMSDDDKQRSVDRFQNEEGQTVIACSLKAAGVGLTLTAASDVLFLEQGWTPGDMDQASDRCHRIGQVDSVTAWNMICADTIDEDIADLIAAKRQVVDAVTDGSTVDDSAQRSVLADLLVRLVGKGQENA